MRVVISAICSCMIGLGCAAPIRTPGTEGLSDHEIARVDVPAHPQTRFVTRYEETKIHAAYLTIDGRDYDTQASDASFLLTPGAHQFKITYGPCTHLLNSGLNPFAGWFSGIPVPQAALNVEAAKQYKLGCRQVGGGSIAHLEIFLNEQ